MIERTLPDSLLDHATPAQWPLPASYRGGAPTSRGLRGRWAVPGTTYPDKLARIANAIGGRHNYRPGSQYENQGGKVI